MTAWLSDLRSADGPRALITVIETKGSTPREAGTRMVVTKDKCLGTIGGGQLEYRIVDIARAMLGNGNGTRQVHELTLGPELKQCCGGVVKVTVDTLSAADLTWTDNLNEPLEPCVVVSVLENEGSVSQCSRLLVGKTSTNGTLGDTELDVQAVEAARAMLQASSEHQLDPAAGMQIRKVSEQSPELLFEMIRAADFHLMLFGAGHVGKALVNCLGTLPCRVTWVDSRADEFPASVPPNVTVCVRDTPADEVARAGANTFFLVMTHSHPMDFQICKAVLGGGFDYLGLIGSKSKRARFKKNLIAQGIPAETTARLTCPIGIDSIKGKHPATIAIAVVAQLIEVYEARTGRGLAALEDRRATAGV